MSKTAKKSKKTLAEARQAFIQCMVALGAKLENKPSYFNMISTLRLNTVHGMLGIWLDTDSVYTRFDTVPKEVPLKIQLNPHSGKWNFHGDLTEPDFFNSVVAVITAVAAPVIKLEKPEYERVFLYVERCPRCLGEWKPGNSAVTELGQNGDYQACCSKCGFDISDVTVRSGAPKPA